MKETIVAIKFLMWYASTMKFEVEFDITGRKRNIFVIIPGPLEYKEIDFRTEIHADGVLLQAWDEDNPEQVYETMITYKDGILDFSEWEYPQKAEKVTGFKGVKIESFEGGEKGKVSVSISVYMSNGVWKPFEIPLPTQLCWCEPDEYGYRAYVRSQGLDVHVFQTGERDKYWQAWIRPEDDETIPLTRWNLCRGGITNLDEREVIAEGSNQPKEKEKEMCESNEASELTEDDVTTMRVDMSKEAHMSESLTTYYDCYQQKLAVVDTEYGITVLPLAEGSGLVSCFIVTNDGVCIKEVWGDLKPMIEFDNVEFIPMSALKLSIGLPAPTYS